MAARSGVKNEKVDGPGRVTWESRRRWWPERGLRTSPALPSVTPSGGCASTIDDLQLAQLESVDGCLPGASPGQGCTRPAMPVFGVSRVGSSSPTTAGGQPRQASTHRPWSHGAEKSGHPAPPDFLYGPRASSRIPRSTGSVSRSFGRSAASFDRMMSAREAKGTWTPRISSSVASRRRSS